MMLFKCLLALAALFNAFSAEPAILPEDCVVCSYVPFNAPCIVNISTGDICEIRVYPPQPNITNAIWEKEEGKDYGYCILMGGYSGIGGGISLPDDNKASFGIKAEALTAYNPFWSRIFLCQNCLDKLDKLEMTNNFVVVDVYGLADGQVEYYALTPDNDFWVRHYHIFAEYDKFGGLDIDVESTYYEGGKELDY